MPEDQQNFLNAGLKQTVPDSQSDVLFKLTEILRCIRDESLLSSISTTSYAVYHGYFLEVQRSDHILANDFSARSSQNSVNSNVHTEGLEIAK